MKKLVNCYTYKKIYEKKEDEYGMTSYISYNTNLKAVYPNRTYQTKMTPDDLPEYYCDVKRYADSYDIISAKDIIDMKYTWVKENHFMKDSILRISYKGNIEPYYDKFIYCGKEIESQLVSYKNVDEMVFNNSIFKFLAYAHKYSKYDLTKIRLEFIEQCEWLNENEPSFAPDLNGLNNYGEWFDNTIKKYQI